MKANVGSVVLDSIKIRKAQACDTEVFLDIRKRAILAACQGVYSAEQLKVWTSLAPTAAFIYQVTDNLYLLESDGQVVASGKLNLDNGQIDGIFVLPNDFGKGFARKMLAYLEQKAKQHGLKQLVLEATLNAVNVYRAFGFVGEQQTQYTSPTGVTLVCIPMKKDIA